MRWIRACNFSSPERWLFPFIVRIEPRGGVPDFFQFLDLIVYTAKIRIYNLCQADM